jgi:hypothetical protein
MADREAALRFLRALFPDVPEDGAILIWALKGRRSSWAISVEDAAGLAVESGGDVYAGACLGPRSILEGKRPEKKRVKAEDVLYMPGVWLDIDFAHTAHQKKNLPPDIDSARALLSKMPLPPSIVIHSGHGLQAWWLFQELAELHEQRDRERAAAVAAGWNMLLKKHAGESDWTVDSVFDLARVMRIPGTKNCKGNSPIDVVTLEHNEDRRCNLDELAEFIPVADLQVPESARPTTSLVSGEALRFSVSIDAQPPFDKFNVAIGNDEQFKETWERKRKDMNDQSPSGYDLSLSTQAVLFGWTDQEIVNLLIAHRRQHGSKEKLRTDYYMMTLQKARRVLEATEADKRIDELAAICQAAAEQGERIADGSKANEFREQALLTLSQKIGVKILAIEKTRSDEPLFIMRTAVGNVKIGGIGAIYAQQIFRQRISVATDLVPEKRKKWDSMIQVILNACTEIDIGPEATDEGIAVEWLKSYLTDHPAQDLDRSPEEPSSNYPTLQTIDGLRHLIVQRRHFVHWLRTAPGFGERIDAKRLGVVLRSIGGRSGTVRHGKLVQRRWIIPLHDALLPGFEGLCNTLGAACNTFGAACNTSSVTGFGDHGDDSSDGKDTGKTN